MFDNIKTKYEDSEFIINEENSKIAINIIKDKIKKNGETSELYCYLSKAVLPLYPQEALKYAKKAVKLDKNYLYAKTRLMYSYAMLCNIKQTLKLIDEILKADNINLYIYSLIMKAFNNIGVSEQNEKYNKVLKILANPDNSPSNSLEYEYKILSCLGLKEYKLFEQYLKEAEEKNLLTSLNYCTISKFYFNKGQYDEALEYTDKALNIDITCDYAYYRKFKIFLKLKKYKIAINNLANSLFFDYTYDERNVLNGFSSLIEVAKYLNKAFKVLIPYLIPLDKFIKDDLKYINLLLDYESYGMLSEIYYEKGNYKEALIYADKAIKENGFPIISLYHNKGLALYNLKDYDNALNAFKTAEKIYIKLNSKECLIDIYLAISYTYFIKKDYKHSLLYAEKLILLDRNIAIAYTTIAGCLYVEEDYDNALNAGLKAESLGCNDDEFTYTLIFYIYYLQNNLEKSLEYVNKAIQINDKYDGFLFFKAEILTKLGRKFEAQVYIKKAETLGKNSVQNEKTKILDIFPLKKCTL